VLIVIEGNAQRRTLTLTNGEIIWDFAGNVWRQTQGTIADSQQPGYSGDASHRYREWDDSLFLQHGFPDSAMPSYTGIPSADGWGYDPLIGEVLSKL
jgi:hypothetical protein